MTQLLTLDTQHYINKNQTNTCAPRYIQTQRSSGTCSVLERRCAANWLFFISVWWLIAYRWWHLFLLWTVLIRPNNQNCNTDTPQYKKRQALSQSHAPLIFSFFSLRPPLAFPPLKDEGGAGKIDWKYLTVATAAQSKFTCKYIYQPRPYRSNEPKTTPSAGLLFQWPSYASPCGGLCRPISCLDGRPWHPYPSWGMGPPTPRLHW